MSDMTKTDESTSAAFLGIVHLVVELTTFYGAVAKGGAAAKLDDADRERVETARNLLEEVSLLTRPGDGAGADAHADS